MKLAIINTQTNTVENTIVPPQGAQAWFVPNGYIGVMSEIAGIGDVYDGENFVKQTMPENNDV